MICKNCKTQIKPSQKFCPKCGMEIKTKKKLSKKAQAFIACACCLVLIITGTIGGLYFYQNNHAVDDSDSNYIVLEEGFTDVKVTDEKTALEAIESVADLIGINNAQEELLIERIDTIDGTNYYRFNQRCDAVSVDGKFTVIAADEEGNSLALISNYVNIEAHSIHMNDNLKQDEVNKNIQKVIGKSIVNVETLDNQKIVYILNDNEYIYAYKLLASTETELYTVFINAEDGSVIRYKSSFDFTSAEVVSADGTSKAIGWKNDDGSYHLYNDEHKISIFDVSSIEIQDTINLWNFKEELGIDTIYSQTNTFDEKGVKLMAYLCRFDDYYRSLGDSGFNQINAAINDNTGTNARAKGVYDKGGTNLKFGVLLVGKDRNIDDIDIISHEYTHMVTRSINNWDGQEAGALNEGISDIFGEIIESSIKGSCDWKHDERNIADPENKKNKQRYPASIEYLENAKHNKKERYLISGNWSNGQTEDYSHFASTIISYSAYLMNNGIDDTNNKKIDMDLLGKLWYKSIYLMQSSCSFSQCRNAVELTARIMLKNGELTRQQYDCVCEAFNAVGIDNAKYSYKYKVKNNFNLRVLNRQSTNDVNFNLKVYKMPENNIDINIFFKKYDKPEIVLDENSLYGNKQISLDDGVYYLEITDLDENAQNSVPIKTKIIVDGDDENAADEVTVRTDFSNIITVEIPNDSGKYEDIYYKYINDTIIPSQEYCGEYNESFSNVPESELYSKIKDLKGISSAYIKDLNKDGIPEMFTVSTLGKGSAKGTDYYEDSIVVDIHCYSLDKSNSVVDCGSIYGIGTFKNADEQVYVYFADSSQPRICVSNNYWTFVSTASTFGQSFKAFAFDKKVQEKESVLYHFSNGNESYTINGENVNIDNANRKASSVFKSLDLSGISIESGWNKFPENCKKICTLGTKYSGNGSYEAFIEDYTELAKHINIDSTNNTDGERKSETTTQVSTISSDPGKFYGNDTAEQLRKSIIGSWGALGSMVPEYNFFADGNASGDMPWTASGTYSISDDKTLIISWAGASDDEEYIWSEESWDDFYSHHEYGTDFWFMTDDGILKINGEEKYRNGVDNFTYNSDGDLMAIISGTWISDKGYKEYQINSDGTWAESTVVVSGETLINRTTLDNGEVEIIDNTTAKLWQEVDSLSQIPGSSELKYDSKNDKISVGGTNNTYSRAKYK